MTETAQTIKESLEIISPYLQQIADKLGTTASELWKLLIKQAYVTGITNIISYVAIILAIFGLFKFWVWMCKPFDEYSKNYEEYCVLSVIMGFVSVGLGMSAIVFLTTSIKETITIFVNPEYWALSQLILLAKGVISF